MKVPVWVMLEDDKYLVVRDNLFEEGIAQLIDDCNCSECVSGMVLHTLYSKSGDYKDTECISVCAKCSKVTYGREHSKAQSDGDGEPQLTDEQARALFTYPVIETSKAFADVKFSAIHDDLVGAGYVDFNMDINVYNISEAGRAVLEAHRAQQQPTTADLQAKPTMQEVTDAMYVQADGDDSLVKPADVRKPKPKAKELTKKQQRDKLFDAIVEALHPGKADKVGKTAKKSIAVAMSDLFAVGAKPEEMKSLAYYCHKEFDGKFTAHAMAKHYAAFLDSPVYQQLQANLDEPPQPVIDDDEEIIVKEPLTPEQVAEADRLMKELMSK
jgi:hypothetical protein